MAGIPCFVAVPAGPNYRLTSVRSDSFTAAHTATSSASLFDRSSAKDRTQVTSPSSPALARSGRDFVAASTPSVASTTGIKQKRRVFFGTVGSVGRQSSVPACPAPRHEMSVVYNESESPVDATADGKTNASIANPLKLLSMLPPAVIAAALASNPEFAGNASFLSHVPLSVPVGLFVAINMEHVAWFLHSKLWHNSLYWMHESHHQPRLGRYELNDVLSVVNAPIAIAMMWYGLHPGLHTILGEVLLGTGCGMTAFGAAYLIVHDGFCHRRLPMEFLANFAYFRRLRAAHLVHHGESAGAEPYGLFLGPQELKIVQERKKLQRRQQREAEAETERATADI